MVAFPTLGQQGPNYWNTQLQQYIDEKAANPEQVAAMVEDAAALQMAGIELAYAESAQAHSTTNIYDATGTALIPGLSVSVEGSGRPVEVEFFADGLWNSTQYLDVLPFIAVNGDTTLGTAATVNSLFTTQGPPTIIKRRLVLSDGVNYTIAAGMMCAAGGGTANIAGNPYGKNYISVVSR